MTESLAESPCLPSSGGKRSLSSTGSLPCDRPLLVFRRDHGPVAVPGSPDAPLSCGDGTGVSQPNLHSTPASSVPSVHRGRVLHEGVEAEESRRHASLPGRVTVDPRFDQWRGARDPLTVGRRNSERGTLEDRPHTITIMYATNKCRVVLFR